MKRAVLAYSGGLDTSVTIRWLVEQGYEVHAVAVDVGQQEDFVGVVERGRLAGAADVRVVDAVDRFAAEYLVHTIKANGLYEGKYPMVSGLARPLIVEEVVKIAREIEADVVAHGCTGKGNDQVRFEVSFGVLAPDLHVLAPIRDANIPREKALVLAEEWGIPLASIVSSYSVDENLWGRTAECGPLEDPWVAPPEDAFARTAPAEARPTEPAEIVIAFERGLPVALDGDAADLPSLIRALDLLGGTYGFGRVDMIENRRVGIKSRELYEVPGALAIIQAHRALEDLTLEREVAHHKPLIEQRWTDLVYDGQWFSPLRAALDAYIDATQTHVTGDVRLRRRVRPVARRGLRPALRTAAQGVVGEAGRRVTEAAGGSGRSSSGSGEPLWAGRFTSAPAPEAHALGRSVHFDVRLAPHDVEVSIAHVHGLEAKGLLTSDDAGALTDALMDVGRRIAEGEFTFDQADEDVHSAIERGVTDLLGDVGARLHAGRSRNDLVVTDLRLWMLAATRRIEGLTIMLVRTLVARAREHVETVMPGTTHARPAQLVTLGHHLLAHAWALLRDLERFDQWAVRASTSPLGAGALATSTLGLDPQAAAARLGFRRPFDNSIDAVSDRDFVQEFLADAAICATHLSRLAADLARWTDPALGWAELDESYTTGSSIMPQKRNPDTAELARAKAARIAAGFVALTSVLQGLPLGYHRDLQEDKEPAFDAADTMELVLPALVGAVDSIRFDATAMRTSAADEGLYATDLAEALVRDGVPFREAHRRTGALLKGLAERSRSLADLSADEWDAFGVTDGAALLDPDVSVRSRTMSGGPSPMSVRGQAEAIDTALATR
jgi:argininosuccinate lyase